MLSLSSFCNPPPQQQPTVLLYSIFFKLLFIAQNFITKKKDKNQALLEAIVAENREGVLIAMKEEGADPGFIINFENCWKSYWRVQLREQSFSDLVLIATENWKKCYSRRFRPPLLIGAMFVGNWDIVRLMVEACDNKLTLSKGIEFIRFDSGIIGFPIHLKIAAVRMFENALSSLESIIQKKEQRTAADKFLCSEFLFSDIRSDVKFIVPTDFEKDGTTTTTVTQIPAHKNILASRSSFFESVFSRHWDNVTTIQSEFPLPIMKAVLSFIYSDDVQPMNWLLLEKPEYWVPAMNAADYYNLSGLKEFLQNYQIRLLLLLTMKKEHDKELLLKRCAWGNAYLQHYSYYGPFKFSFDCPEILLDSLRVVSKMDVDGDLLELKNASYYLISTILRYSLDLVYKMDADDLLELKKVCYYLTSADLYIATMIQDELPGLWSSIVALRNELYILGVRSSDLFY